MIDTDEVLNILKNVYDPEIRINIVDLGLVYSVDLTNLPQLSIDMTFTAPNCPMSEQILNDVKHNALKLDGVEQVDVNIVWEPSWTKEMMSEEGRLTLSFDM